MAVAASSEPGFESSICWKIRISKWLYITKRAVLKLFKYNRYGTPEEFTRKLRLPFKEKLLFNCKMVLLTTSANPLLGVHKKELLKKLSPLYCYLGDQRQTRGRDGEVWRHSGPGHYWRRWTQRHHQPTVQVNKHFLLILNGTGSPDGLIYFWYLYIRVSHNDTFSSILMGAQVFPIPSCPLSPNIAKKPVSVTYFRYMSTSTFFQNLDFLHNLKKK